MVLLEPMRVEIRILGPLVVQVGATEVSLGGSLRRAVLLRLVLSHDTWLDAARLSDAVWGGDESARTANRLQAQITLLRRALGTGALLTEGSSYRLDRDRVVIDSDLFERDVNDARSLLHAGRPHEAVAVSRSALARWRGSALIDIATYEWAMSTIAYLMELKGLAHEVLLESLLATESFADVVVAAEQAVAEQPLRESLWHSMMLALARSGRTAESARAFQRFRTVLREEVGLDPSRELANLDASILAGTYSSTALGAPIGERDQRIAESLPRFATSMIGRQHEVEDISEAVNHGGLVTLVGAGGVGKTRIAVAVASRVRESFPDGVWFVDLAAVTESSGVATATCRAIGLTVNPAHALDHLVRSMSSTKALVILDNCEQVLDGVAQLAEAFGSANHGFCLLTTSREALAVEHEILRPIRPLLVGDVNSGGALDLFLRRASDLGGALDPHDYTVVAEICARLDGLPLAIELAATRVRALGPSDLLEALSERLDSLRSSRKFAKRHRTLRLTVEWSFDLLDRRQQLGFSLLAVFLGGFDVRAAQAILATEGFTAVDTIDLLSELVDKSMIEVESSISGRRFRLLETLRQFAVERLLKHGPEMARDEHAIHYERRVTELLTALRSPSEKEASDAFLVDDGNIRAAFEWSISRDDFETAATIAEIAWEFGYQRMNYEALDWIEAIYDEALHRRIAAMPALAAIRGVSGWVRSGVPDGMAWIDEAYRLAASSRWCPQTVFCRARRNCSTRGTRRVRWWSCKHLPIVPQQQGANTSRRGHCGCGHSLPSGVNHARLSSRRCTPSRCVERMDSRLRSPRPSAPWHWRIRSRIRDVRLNCQPRHVRSLPRRVRRGLLRKANSCSVRCRQV